MSEPLDSAPVGFLSFTDDGIIQHANGALISYLNSHQLTGKKVESIFTLPTRIFFQTHLFPLVKMHGFADEIFVTLLGKSDQGLPVLLNAKRMDWEGKKITTFAFIIVHNRKKFEDELVAAKKTAEASLRENTELQKARTDLQSYTEQLERQMELVKRQNREMQQFNHVVTHNLKEPLRKMQMYSGRLATTLDMPDMEKLLRATDQMKHVVSGLQQYVWLTEKSNQFINLQLNDVVSKAGDQVKEDGNAHLFDLHVESLGNIEGDAEQLQILFYHLLTNAVKFKKEEKAVVTIGSTLLKKNTFRSLTGKYQYEDFLRISIRDNGVGFDPLYKENVFELFRKLHYAEGQGLGLALCRKIAENHSGSIEAETQVNLYTEIILWLPLKQG